MNTLLVIHILSGVIALASSLAALATAKGKQWHKRAGLTYFWSMVSIILVPLIFWWKKKVLSANG